MFRLVSIVSIVSSLAVCFLCFQPSSALPTTTTMSATTPESTSYFNGSFTAPGLPVFQRTITGHKEDGLGHFLVSDNGDHRIIRTAAGFNYEGAQSVMYGTFEVPLDITGVDDLSAIHEGYKV